MENVREGGGLGEERLELSVGLEDGGRYEDAGISQCLLSTSGDSCKDALRRDGSFGAPGIDTIKECRGCRRSRLGNVLASPLSAEKVIFLFIRDLLGDVLQMFQYVEDPLFRGQFLVAVLPYRRVQTLDPVVYRCQVCSGD